jgi:hypothetical protein
MISFSITMGIILFACFVMIFCAKYKRLTCPHKGMVTLKDMTTPSTVTRFVEASGKAVAGDDKDGALSPNEMWLYRAEVAQKHILVLLCPDCGKIKKIVTEF